MENEDLKAYTAITGDGKSVYTKIQENIESIQVNIRNLLQKMSKKNVTINCLIGVGSNYAKWLKKTMSGENNKVR